MQNKKFSYQGVIVVLLCLLAMAYYMLIFRDAIRRGMQKDSHYLQKLKNNQI